MRTVLIELEDGTVTVDIHEYKIGEQYLIIQENGGYVTHYSHDIIYSFKVLPSNE